MTQVRQEVNDSPLLKERRWFKEAIANDHSRLTKILFSQYCNYTNEILNKALLLLLLVLYHISLCFVNV